MARRKRKRPQRDYLVYQGGGRRPQPAPKTERRPGGPAGPYRGQSTTPSVRKGGSPEATVPYNPPTPTAPGVVAAPARSVVKRSAPKAKQRQQRLIDRFVTHAYNEKVSKLDKAEIPTLRVGERVQEAKREVESLRERLLTHPSVEKANSEGKVVSPRGLEKLNRREKQYHAIEGPKGVSYSREYGLVPRSLKVGPKGLRQLQRQEYFGNQGTVAKTRTIARERAQEESQPSTIEALSIASLGIPGIGVGSSVANLAKLGSKALPIIASKEGAKQAASVVASRAAGASLAAKSSVRELPQVLRASPQLAKAAAKAAPRVTKEAVRNAPRAVPRAVGRGALRTGTTTYKAGTGLGLLAATQNAGIETEPGKVADAILKGTSAAVSKHPLETAETTARAIPAAVTAPAALLYATGQIPFEGTEPLAKTAEMQWEGLKQIGGNVLSGDPKRVQKAVQGEGALAFLAPLPAITRTRPYKAVRTDVREAAAGIRRLSGKGRQAPKGVEQSVFGFTDKRAARKRVAITHTRTTNPHRISEARHEKAVLHGTARRPALEKVPAEWGDTISTLLEAGIRSPEGVKLMRERGPKTGPSETGKVNLDRALSIAEANPQMFASKPFQRALRAAEKASRTTPAALAGMGEVARYRTQGNLFGITPPDRAVPHVARRYTSAKDREGAWRDLKLLETRLQKLQVKRQGRGRGGRKPKNSRRDAEIKLLETRTKGLREALDPYTRPDQKTASGERKFWDRKLEEEYIDAVKARQKDSPLVEPAWTHHATFENAKLGMEPGSLPGKAGGKVYVRRGRLEESDLVDRSLQAFIRGTVQMPRRRQGGADFARQFVRQEKIPYTVGGKAKEIVPDSETWARITSPKSKDNPDGGQFDPDTYARFPTREWKTAVEDPFTTEADLYALLDDAEAGRIAGHEPSVIVPRESIREFRALVNPEHGPVTTFFNALGRTSSRLILGTNPSWVIAQTVAEGIPLLLAKPSLLNPAKTGSILKDIAEYRRQNPEQAAIIEGAAGASPEITAGSLRSPLDLEKRSQFSPQPALFASAAKELTRGKWGRAMRSTAKLEPLGLFDIKRQNAYRSVLLAAQADKQFRGWTNGVRGMFRSSSRLSERFKGKSREELWTWLSTTKEGKRELQKLASYVDDVQGNWTAFTRYERAFAPFVIFYPFLRYSLRWTLWTFPKTHPVAATIAYTLGSVNANELEKVLGAKPASPLSYSWPVVADAEGKRSVLPGGSRIAPGQSVVQQAIAGGKPSQLVGGLNPILGAALTGLGGPGPFGDKPEKAGWAAVDQLLSLPAPLRLADVKSEKVAAMFGLTRPQPESVIAIAFEKLDPNKKLRQGLLPSVPQSAKEARMSNRLSRALSEASANSKSKREDVAGDDSLTVKERQRKIKEMKARSDKAKAAIDGVLKSLGLDKENSEAYERYKESLYGAAEEGSGIYDKGSLYEKGSIYESGGIYGDKGNSKALQYKPPGAGGIDLPNVSAPLGALGNLLSAAILGEKAQAAEPKGKARPPGPLPFLAMPEQQRNARIVLREGERAGASRKEKLAAITTGLVETGGFENPSGGDADSAGWRQERAMYYENPTNVAASARRFFAEAKSDPAIPGGGGETPGELAQTIQGSAFPERYGERLPEAKQILRAYNQTGVRQRKPLPKKIKTRYKAAVTAANELEQARLPYVWGGGHGDPRSRPTGGGLDCSGAVSYVLNKMGALKGSLVSGDMGSALRPGPGAVTVFYNPTHTFMRIGKKYFGTSTANPAGGAGYIPASVGASEAASGRYNVGHVPGLGKKVAVALGVPTGSSGAHATSTFPGMTLSSNGTVASLDPSAATTRKEAGFSEKPIKQTPTERLKLVKEITSGNLEGLGVPSGGDGSVGPSATDLAALGAELQSTRRRLLRR